MEKIWAPWRMEYIKAAREPTGECLFCRIAGESDDRANYLLYRGKVAFVILNKYPYTNGHIMVVPYRHTANLNELTAEDHTELGQLIAACCTYLQEMAKPHGYNIGMNLGQIAGAGIADHLHYHVVPRWSGDTNFMPVIGETRVINESLDAVFDALYPLFNP